MARCGREVARQGYRVPLCPRTLARVIPVTARSSGVAYIPHMSSTTKTNRTAWLQGPSAPCEHPPEGSLAPYRLILLGAPGVGKGTQADLLRQRLRACHLSTGDVFRAAATGECETSPAMTDALGFMRRGELVPDSIVWEMVRERSGCLRCRGGFILDGFPRTLSQAEALKKLMDQEGLSLTAAVSYDLPLNEIVARLSGRRTCAGCKAVYHATERPPKVEGRCDRCNAVLFQREDDRPESIKIRMEAYERSTAPLIDFYEDLGVLLRVAANGTPDDIFNRTAPELEARRVRQFAQSTWKANEDRR